jgi:hypothetical protein
MLEHAAKLDTAPLPGTALWVNANKYQYRLRVREEREKSRII